MPKILPNENDMKNRILIGSMENRMRIMGYEKREVARKSGIADSTFYYRLNHPDTFSLKELRAVFKVLKYPGDEAERILKEAVC